MAHETDLQKEIEAFHQLISDEIDGILSLSKNVISEDVISEKVLSSILSSKDAPLSPQLLDQYLVGIVKNWHKCSEILNASPAQISETQKMLLQELAELLYEMYLQKIPELETLILNIMPSFEEFEFSKTDKESECSKTLCLLYPEDVETLKTNCQEANNLRKGDITILNFLTFRQKYLTLAENTYHLVCKMRKNVEFVEFVEFVDGQETANAHLDAVNTALGTAITNIRIVPKRDALLVQYAEQASLFIAGQPESVDEAETIRLLEVGANLIKNIYDRQQAIQQAPVEIQASRGDAHLPPQARVKTSNASFNLKLLVGLSAGALILGVLAIAVMCALSAPLFVPATPLFIPSISAATIAGLGALGLFVMSPIAHALEKRSPPQNNLVI